jgi:hypothetical protein
MWIDFRRISSLHESYLSALGRAIAISQHLEDTLKYVLNLVEIVEEGKKDEDVLDRLDQIHDRVRRRMLGNAIDRLEKIGVFRNSNFETLKSGRDARNYFAHEAGLIVSEVPDRPDEIALRIKTFEDHLTHVIEADNLVSSWSYSIQEKAAPPFGIGASYMKKMFSWVTAPIKDCNSQ